MQLSVSPSRPPSKYFRQVQKPNKLAFQSGFPKAMHLIRRELRLQVIQSTIWEESFAEYQAKYPFHKSHLLTWKRKELPYWWTEIDGLQQKSQRMLRHSNHTDDFITGVWARLCWQTRLILHQTGQSDSECQLRSNNVATFAWVFSVAFARWVIRLFRCHVCYRPVAHMVEARLKVR